ncbi:MAG: hypothetical protein Tsb0020_44390 [Haliangiales bacterium]
MSTSSPPAETSPETPIETPAETPAETPIETPAELTPELIERLRQTGIRLDRAGRLWHEGEEIKHSGLRRAILRWLDRREQDGRPIIRFDDTRYAYIDIEDAALLVTSARWERDRVWLRLNDDSEEELDYKSLTVGADDALYCLVRGGRLSARVTTPAYYVLAEGIEPVAPDESHAPGGGELFALRARGQRFVIGERQS